MSWTKEDYPESMKNLPTETRNKAIEIANALLDEDYAEGRAIAIAISQAEKMNDSSDELPYHIVPHNDEWAIKRENATRVTEVFSTKEKALNKARDLVKEKNVQLTIHRRDGTFERVQYTN